jgi:hypothetical protein
MFTSVMRVTIAPNVPSDAAEAGVSEDLVIALGAMVRRAEDPGRRGKVLGRAARQGRREVVRVRPGGVLQVAGRVAGAIDVSPADRVEIEDSIATVKAVRLRRLCRKSR